MVGSLLRNANEMYVGSRQEMEKVVAWSESLRWTGGGMKFADSVGLRGSGLRCADCAAVKGSSCLIQEWLEAHRGPVGRLALFGRDVHGHCWTVKMISGRSMDSITSGWRYMSCSRIEPFRSPTARLFLQ